MKLFEKLSKTSCIMLIAISAISFILLIVGLIVIYLIYPFEGPLPFMLGIAVGCVSSMIKVILLEKSISRAIDMEKERATSFAYLFAFGRYVLTIAVFAIVIMFPSIFGLFGTIVGVLALQFASHITNLVLKKLV